MSKKQRRILTSLMILPFTCAVISLFYPYLLKLNICCGDKTLPKFYNGYDYTFTYPILFFMLASMLCILKFKSQIALIVFNVFILFLIWLVRLSIHYQGYIDHDYDSKTGFGFLLLFISVTVHFILSILALTLEKRSRILNPGRNV